MQRTFNIHRKWRLLLYSSLGLLLTLFIANIIINGIIQHKISEKLQHLSPHVKVSFSSLHSNLFASSLKLNNLTVNYTPNNNQHQHTLRFTRVTLDGINFIMILFRQTLSVKNFILSDGEVNLDSFLLNKRDTILTDLVRQASFKRISVSQFEAFHLRISEDNKPLLKGNIALDDIDINDVTQALTTENFHFGAIKSKLSDIHYTLPNAGYTLMIKQLILDSPKGILQTDSLQLAPPHNTNDQPLCIDNMTIHHPDIPLLFDKKLAAEKIMLQNAVVKIHRSSKITSLMDVKKVFSSIKADLFSVNRADIAYEETTGNQLTLQGKVAIHQLKITDSTPIRFNTLTCSLHDIQAINPSAYQRIQIKKLDIDHQGTLQATSVQISPLYNKYETGQKAGHQIDVMNAVISGITVTKLDVSKLFQQAVIAEQIWIKESKFEIFRDRRLPRTLQYRPLPVVSLKEIPVHIRAHHLKVSESTVSYEEYPKDGQQTGLLKIEKFRLSVSPFINHPTPSDPDHMNLEMEGSLMGSGTIRTSVYLPFNPGKDYYVSGAIDNLDVTTLNSAAENLGHFHVESGMLNNLSFQFSLNDEKASGKVVGEYHQLVLDKLKGQQKKVAKFPSFMLKHVIIPKNKDKSLPVSRRTGTIDYKFDHTRYFSFYLLKSLLSGIDNSFTFGFLLPK
ncbi:DUF748 domain-containing protein [Chitinophaga qingshengii]|uniref:DUF748 domain-containing protein n=1 Tax=Chitinophaga qingshengii TaxID=1569794 RepID=A0ABR7TVW6_9BACT|nr:DUF748 domain-containing protein [Chitinophaga qingshengii]MBC9934143.1 DUF748 domain-containing protein [Chitinophaga qingshengii]